MTTTEPLPPGWQLLRKKPVIVAAIQWTGSNEAQVQALTGRENFYALDPGDRANCDDPDATATVFDKLHSTWVLVFDGQWVVKGIEGEFYPLHDPVRVKTYDKAEDVPAVVVATQTVMDGLVLRWYRSVSAARHYDAAVLSASRSGVMICGASYLHDIPAVWLAAADQAYALLKDGQRDDARKLATHRHPDPFSDELVEVER